MADRRARWVVFPRLYNGGVDPDEKICVVSSADAETKRCVVSSADAETKRCVVSSADAETRRCVVSSADAETKRCVVSSADAENNRVVSSADAEQQGQNDKPAVQTKGVQTPTKEWLKAGRWVFCPRRALGPLPAPAPRSLFFSYPVPNFFFYHKCTPAG
jgi:hypothetical protein